MMEDRKYDRRCDTGSAFPLRTSTNQPTRSMGSPAVPVLMKSSSSKNLQDEVSEKRRRECMSQQLRGGPSLPSKSLFLGALGGSKVATASDLPTITGKKPLPRALLPKEARKNSYQSLISGPFAFSSGLGVTTGPAYGMQQRRSSISSCYPLRPGAVRFDRVSNGTGADKMSTENRFQTADDALWQLSQDKARRNSVNTLSPPPMDVTTQISLSRGRTSAGSGGGGGVAVEKQNIDTGSIYPMLRMAFGKDENDDDSTVIRRNPGREGTGRKERPVSYADPHSFRKMQEDLQTPEYMEYHHPPSYDPPPEPTKTSFDTHYAFVRSESSSISNNTPGLQDNDFEKASNSIPLQTLTRNSNNTISEDHSRRVPRLSEEVKPQLQDSLQDNFEITKKPEALSPSTTGPKLQSPISTKLDEISPNETETKNKSPVTLKTETISPYTTEPKIQSPLTTKPKAISTNPAGSNREDWYSPIPASPRRVIRSPLLSSGSSAKSKDSPFENMRKPRSAFNFDIEVNPRSVKDSTKHEENESYTSSPKADQNLMAEENNNDTPPELPSSAPPPLPLASHPLGAPVLSPSGPRHPDLEYNSTPDTTPENRSSKPTRDRTAVETVTPTLPTIASPPLPVTPPPTSVQHISLSKQRHPDLENDGSSDKTADNWSSNQSTNDSETFEIAAPALSCSFSPSLPVNSHPTDAPIIPPSGLHHTALEQSSSSNSPATIPEICSKEPINDDSTTVETLPPALPSSAPPPLPVTSPPTNAPIIPPFVEHHEDLQHISSSETDSYLNEAVTSNEHGATAESINDGMEQTESIGRQQRQSLSSEESLLEGQETKASAAQNRETLSPTLSDADSGIDSVKLEQKRSYETSMTNEEYQTALWDEQSETPAAGKIDRAVSPVSNDRNIIDATSPDATLSNVNPASVEPQPVIRNASDSVVMSSPADVVPTPIETGSECNEEPTSIKTKTSITPDKETDASVPPTQNGEDKSAFSEDDRKTSSGDLPLDPLSPTGDQISPVKSELSEKKCDVALIGQGKLTMVHIHKGIMGLGFSVQGGKGSAYGDKPLTVKKIFKAGDASVREVLTVGDELISANGKDLTNCSSHEAWSYLKTLPDGTVDLVIGKVSDA